MSAVSIWRVREGGESLGCGWCVWSELDELIVRAR